MAIALERQSRIDFVLTLRRRWADALYPALRRQYDDAGGPAVADVGTAAATTHALPSYGWFAWLERGSQKQLWRAVGDAVAAEPVQRRLDGNGPSRLELDPGLELPDWYTAWDIHVQPGGVWANDAAADVYELGAKLVMLGVNDDYTFHRAFVETAIPRRAYRRIVDFGCGFGKSAWPMKRAFPEAEVIGIDLAAPCLRLATDKTNAQGLAVTYRQADCRKTGLEAGTADLVTSTMLIHEMPLPAIAETLQEAARLLAPGGLLRFLDFTCTGDAFRDLAMEEHGERNNEPFLPASMKADVPAMARQAGFRDAAWVAFDERGGGRLPTLAWPKRPEWHFPWALFEATRA
ncbi:MAG: class I SAM-dependent methyltransferase [Alphaproteobacteria bacterium]|nr:class I SAM-dependent methyltransferase [Alphaproteobacteria bacterium]